MKGEIVKMIKYTAPEMDVVIVETEDVILASGSVQEPDPNAPGVLPEDNEGF